MSKTYQNEILKRQQNYVKKIRWNDLNFLTRQKLIKENVLKQPRYVLSSKDKFKKCVHQNWVKKIHWDNVTGFSIDVTSKEAEMMLIFRPSKYIFRPYIFGLQCIDIMSTSSRRQVDVESTWIWFSTPGKWQMPSRRFIDAQAMLLQGCSWNVVATLQSNCSYFATLQQCCVPADYTLKYQAIYKGKFFHKNNYYKQY